MTERAILSVKWTPAAGLGRVAGFVRYVSFRDHHQVVESDRRLEGLMRYVAHRDPTAKRGRVFDANGPAGDRSRAELLRFVQRSCAGTPIRDGRSPQRAVYRFVLSPEFAEGLDLKRLTRTMMNQLDRDSGGLGPWIAAEHRNTVHPHVHVVLAARREVAPGRYRSVVVTRERLARMKLVVAHDIELQREDRVAELEWTPIARNRVAQSKRQRQKVRSDSYRLTSLRLDIPRRLRHAMKRLARHYEVEADRDRRQRERESGWER